MVARHKPCVICNTTMWVATLCLKFIDERLSHVVLCCVYIYVCTLGRIQNPPFMYNGLLYDVFWGFLLRELLPREPGTDGRATTCQGPYPLRALRDEVDRVPQGWRGGSTSELHKYIRASVGIGQSGSGQLFVCVLCKRATNTMQLATLVYTITVRMLFARHTMHVCHKYHALCCKDHTYHHDRREVIGRHPTAHLACGRCAVARDIIV